MRLKLAARVVAVSVLAVLLAVALLTCEAPPQQPPVAERVPTLADFADFLSWERTPVVATDRFPHAVYANALAREGRVSGTYALGSAFVQVEESGPHQTWLIHAMAFRGGEFNAQHARGWEFFGLYLDERSTPHVIWHADRPPLGAGYAEADTGVRSDAGPFGLDPGDCRTCHHDPEPIVPY